MRESSRSSLARYAIRDEDSGGRAHDEPMDPLRSPFAVDRHRIIESAAFRRLEGKTQVFTATEHDHFRTRMTHTLEVSQIARCLAHNLGANEQLAEVIALAHDLGHPPFGHAGEAALNGLMCDHGGFNHNTHSLRVVEYLEHPFPPFRGLNLTAATREGLAVHATRYDTPLFNQGGSNGGVEAQIASIADRVAYNCHDLEDAIGAEIITLAHLRDLSLWREAFAQALGRNPVTSIFAVRRVVLDALVDNLLKDAVATSRTLLANFVTPTDVARAVEPVVRLSHDRDRELLALERFLTETVYRHKDIAVADTRGREMVSALFDAYKSQPERMPPRYAGRVQEQGAYRVACDYVAGMTDRFCTQAYKSIVESTRPGNGE